jgi:hypothetical protein
VHGQTRWNITYHLHTVKAAYSVTLNEESTLPSNSSIKLKVTQKVFQKPTVHKICCRSSTLTSSIHPTHKVAESCSMKRFWQKPNDGSTKQTSFVRAGRILGEFTSKNLQIYMTDVLQMTLSFKEISLLSNHSNQLFGFRIWGFNSGVCLDSWIFGCRAVQSTVK